MTRSLEESLEGGSPVQWAEDFLVHAGLPVTPANVQAVYSWEYAESGAGGGKWNPLNTTQGGFAGETDANSVGVKNYATRQDGIAANARVIHNGFYSRVIAALERGNDAQAVVRAITSSPWGTRAIMLRPVPGIPTPAPPHPIPIPTPEDDVPRLFPSATNPNPNKFRGAVVDVHARTIDLVGGAVLEPAAHPNNPNPWWGAEGGPGEFTVTTADTDQYHYRLP